MRKHETSMRIYETSMKKEARRMIFRMVMTRSKSFIVMKELTGFRHAPEKIIMTDRLVSFPGSPNPGDTHSGAYRL